MQTKYFSRFTEWGEYGYFLTPGPLSDEDMSYNCIEVDLDTDKIINKSGKKYNFYIDYNEQTQSILYGARPLNAVGSSVVFDKEIGTETDFLNKVKELDSKEKVRDFLNKYIGEKIKYV